MASEDYFEQVHLPLEGFHHTEEPEERLIHDTSNKRVFLNFHWGFGNKMIIFAGLPPPHIESSEIESKNDSEIESKNDSEEDNEIEESIPIAEFSWNIQPQQTNQLIEDSVALYEQIQFDIENPIIRERQNQAIMSMRALLAITRACLKSIENVKEDEIEAQHKRDLIEETQDLLIYFDSIASLCEITILSSSITPAPQIINWLDTHYFATNDIEDAIEIINDTPTPESLDEYWIGIAVSLMQGKLESVVNFLEKHSQRFDSAFKSIFNDLIHHFLPQSRSKVGMPYASSFDSSIAFYTELSKWQKSLRVTIQDIQSFAPLNRSDALCSVIEIALGNKTAITEWSFKSQEQQWANYFSGCLMYADPLIKSSQLSSLFQETIDKFDIDEDVKAFSHVFDHNIPLILELMQAMGHTWGVFLLYSIFMLAGVVEDSEIEYAETSLSEYYLLDFVRSFISQKQLWNPLCSFLRQTRSQSRSYVEIILSRVFPENDQIAKDLMKVAEDNSMRHVSLTIAKTRAQFWNLEKRLDYAVLWFLQAERPDLIDSIIRQVLDPCFDEDDFHKIMPHISELDRIFELIGTDDSLIQCSMLAFAHRYREYLLVLEDLDALSKQCEAVGGNVDNSVLSAIVLCQQEAARRLVAMITTCLAPQQYWPKLFLRLAPYLRNSVTPTQPSLVLPIVDVQRLMLSFEQLFLNKRTQRYTEMKLTEQEIQLIRLSLSQHFAFSISAESFSSSSAWNALTHNTTRDPRHPTQQTKSQSLIINESLIALQPSISQDYSVSHLMAEPAIESGNELLE